MELGEANQKQAQIRVHHVPAVRPGPEGGARHEHQIRANDQSVPDKRLAERVLVQKKTVALNPKLQVQDASVAVRADLANGA